MTSQEIEGREFRNFETFDAKTACCLVLFKRNSRRLVPKSKKPSKYCTDIGGMRALFDCVQLWTHHMCSKLLQQVGTRIQSLQVMCPKTIGRHGARHESLSGFGVYERCVSKIDRDAAVPIVARFVDNLGRGTETRHDCSRCWRSQGHLPSWEALAHGGWPVPRQPHDFTLEVDRHEGIVENKYRDGTFSPDGSNILMCSHGSVGLELALPDGVG